VLEELDTVVSISDKSYAFQEIMRSFGNNGTGIDKAVSESVLEECKQIQAFCIKTGDDTIFEVHSATPLSDAITSS
jgi:hypothetical protein